MSANDVIFDPKSRGSVLDSINSLNDISIEKVVITYVGMTNEIFKKFEQNIGNKISYSMPALNKYDLSILPKNACIGVRITDGLSAINKSQCILFPFFSSHIALPIKSGEVVWAIFDRGIKDAGYWMTRCHSDNRGEDLNFSHYDTRFLETGKEEKQSLKNRHDKAKSSKENERIAENAYVPLSFSEEIFEAAINNNLSSCVTFEPVPRYTKRPGDFVIQGSNNSMICLGTDRYRTKEEVSGSISDFGGFRSSEVLPNFRGSVDIVAGRSRHLMNNVLKNPEFYNDQNVISTTPYISKNETLRSFQVEKSEEKQRISEGDPDFYSDAARIYISMGTNIDTALSLKDYTPILHVESSIRQTLSGSAVLSKADHVRIIARKDDDFLTNGTIKIIKEGKIRKESDQDILDGCSVSLLEDGKVHIFGQKIYLGISDADGGLSDKGIDGKNYENVDELLGERQPYIRYQELKSMVVLLLQQIDSLKKSFNDHVSKYNSHTHSGTSITYINTAGVPTPAVTIITPPSDSTSHSYEFENEIGKKIPDIKSKRIFGE